MRLGRSVPHTTILESSCYNGTQTRRVDWLPADGVTLTRYELERIVVDLRALIDGTESLEPNRAYAVDIAVTIARALDRDEGGER